MIASQTAGKRDRQRSDHREPDDLDGELYQVDVGRAQKATGHEVDGDEQRAKQASRELGDAEHNLEHRGHSEQLRGENRQRADPYQDGNGGAEVAAISALEKIADGQVSVCDGFPPHARTDGECEDETANPCRSIPPPCAEPIAIAQAGGANCRSCSDVAGQKGREDEQRAKRASRDEEVSRGSNAPPDPQADAGHEQGIGD